jgi:hypothetical protein
VLGSIDGNIDIDADEAISENEQRGYVERVLRDLSLAVDGDRLPLRLVSMRFPKVAEMKQGLGEIQLAFDTAVPAGGRKRKLIFQNHHQPLIAAYLVNCLVPQDPDIRITAQNRDYLQSFYELDYTQAGGHPASVVFGWLGMLALVLSARLAFLWRR